MVERVVVGIVVVVVVVVVLVVIVKVIIVVARSYARRRRGPDRPVDVGPRHRVPIIIFYGDNNQGQVQGRYLRRARSNSVGVIAFYRSSNQQDQYV